jgi:hypothetical protein
LSYEPFFIETLPPGFFLFGLLIIREAFTIVVSVAITVAIAIAVAIAILLYSNIKGIQHNI